MRDPRAFKKDLSILNAEGDILRLYTHHSGELYFASRLTNHSGKVFYPVTVALIKDYLQSKLLLRDLFIKSDTEDVKVLLRGDVTTTSKEAVLEHIDCLEDSYQYIAPDMKKKEFEERFLGLQAKKK
ncbi:hypothetical protein [Psychroflexus tropicus]|uniref:hypothetical protein n=1 Tax=Psychroflexus tropicus TaxID=197345 RepID=UPI0012F71E5F|nr:hypothetical protein [Psychroflexus tropicus]